jgi:hypothetical protein
MSSPGVGVYTPDLRFEFVAGHLVGEPYPPEDAVICGPGTEFCAEVTNDQLAEIMYRVKDSQLGGELVLDTGDYVIEKYGFSGTPGSNLVESATATQSDEYEDEYSFYVYSARGYWTQDTDGYDGYFGDSYEVDTDLPFDLGGDHYDAASNERAMWISKTTNVGFNNPMTESGYDYRFKTGLNHFLCAGEIGEDYYGSPYLTNIVSLLSIPIAYTKENDVVYSASVAYCRITGKVAWIDDNNSGNPFDPENRRFVGLEFQFFAGTVPDLAFFITSQNYPVWVEDFEEWQYAEYHTNTGRTLSIPLQSGTVTIPLYTTGPAADEYTTWSGGLTLTPTKWWPYAIANPAAAMWDKDTGTKL